MTQAWRDAVFRIDSEAQTSHAFGSGFVCQREGDRTYVLTCNHVIAAIGEAHARIRQLPIQVVARGDGTLDLALIAVDGLTDGPVLSLSDAGESGRPFVVYGYTWADPNDKKSGKSLARPLEGRLGADTAFASDQWPKVPAWDLPFDQNDQFAELLDGYSGSPVWDPHNQSVIAVVSHRRGKKMGYAIAVSNLLKFYPQAAAFFRPAMSILPNAQSEMIERKVSPAPTRIFVSYSHKDRAQKEQVMTILHALPPGIEIKAWDDTRMLAGDAIDPTIFSEIESSDVFLALISRNYLASAYCKEEMKTALRQVEQRGCRVVPVIVRETASWREYPIGQKLALPPDGKAPTDWTHEDQHWTAVEKGLLNILQDMQKPQAESVVKPTPGIHRQSTIPQDPIDTLDERGFFARLKKELAKSLSSEKVRPLIAELTDDPNRTSAETGVSALLALEPLASIRRWTEITAAWFKDLSPHERHAAWDAVRDVHLNLLPRVVDPDWLSRWQDTGHKSQDRRLLTVSLKQRSPNRSVEVLVARVDARCGAVRFYEADEAATVQAHNGQINTANEAWRAMQKPTAEQAVQRVGRHLLAQYRPDLEPPPTLQAEDWEDLNDYIVESPAGLFHYYYLVIPEDDPDYANDDVLRLLYEKMPNLPRVLLSTQRGTNPLICRQNRLEALIDAFWDIRRMEFA